MCRPGNIRRSRPGPAPSSGPRSFAVSAMKCTPAEDDREGNAGGGDPRQFEGVAHVIGDILDRRCLVVVGQEHGVLCVASRRTSPPRPRSGRGTRGNGMGGSLRSETSGRGGFLLMRRKLGRRYHREHAFREPRRVTVSTIPNHRTGRSAYPHQALAVAAGPTAAAARHALAARQGPVRGRVGAARRTAAARGIGSATSVDRQLAAKVDVPHVAHLEQLATHSDPAPRSPGPGGDRVPRAGPADLEPNVAAGHRLAAGGRVAADGVRPRLVRRDAAWRGCGPSSPTRTSGSPSRRRRSRSRSCATSTSPRWATRSAPPT